MISPNTISFIHFFYSFESVYSYVCLFVLTLNLSSLSGVYPSERLELSASEGGSYLDTGDHRAMQRGWWTSRPQKGAPEKRGHYRDQHQPEDLDPDLLMVEDQENSTQTVVKFARPFLSIHLSLHF